MNEFYTGNFRTACDFCKIPFYNISNQTEIINKALNALSEKERTFIEMIYPLHSADNFAGTERRNIIHASKEFTMSKDEAKKFRDKIQRKIISNIEKLLKGEEIH